MKIPVHIVFVALPSLVVAACTSAPRIDGSSQASFEHSYAAVMASLSPQDQARLSLAQLIVLSPKGCLTTKPIPSQTFINESLGGQADLTSCRKELDGYTFKDIMNLAYPDGELAGVGASGSAIQ